MQVLLVNSNFRGGGVDNQTYELARGLVAAAIEPLLAVPAHSRLTATAQSVVGLRVEILPSGRIAYALALSRLIRRVRPDIVHAQHGRDYWPTVIARALSGTAARVVVSRHLTGVPSVASRRFLLRVADVVAVSKAVYRVLDVCLSGPRARLHQIYGGVDCEYFQPPMAAFAATAKAGYSWPADSIVFGVLGYFNPPRGKGQLEFLAAAAEIHQQHPLARFLIVGSGELLPQMRQMIADADMQSVCVIAPWQNDVREALAATDVLVYPAVEPEALGIALWEAMACGRPVIGSALGGIPEAFVDGRHGCLVPAGDIVALAEAMSGLAGDAARREQWGAAARQHVLENFSTTAQAHRMAALYRAILQRSG